MAVTSTPIYAQKVQSWAAQVLPADTTTKKTIVTAGANGTQLSSLTITSTDTAAQNMIFWLFDGTTSHQLAYIAIPANSGNTAAAAPVDVFRSLFFPGMQLDPFGNKVLNLPSGWTLQGSMVATITAAKVVEVIAQGGDY